MIVENQTRAYLRAIPGLPIDRQREMAADAGCIVYEFGEARGQDVRSAWIRSLREGDTAWLPSLLVLVVPRDKRPEKYRPTSDLGAVLAEMFARRVVIYDAKARVSSADPSAWGRHVKLMLEKASQGERSFASIRRATKKGMATRTPGVVTRWLADAKALDRLAAQRIWTSTLYKSDRDAAAALPAELAQLSGNSIRAILGPRRPGDERAGGRPRKDGKSKVQRVRYVYFIQRGRAKEVKIGSAYDVRSRLTTLRTSTADDLRLIGVLAGDDSTERIIQQKFAAHWIRREWYRLDGDLAEFVKHLPKHEPK